MINTYKNLQVTKKHNIFIKNLPLQAGEIVDVFIVPRKYNSSYPQFPLAGLPMQYSDPFEPAIETDDWEVNK